MLRLAVGLVAAAFLSGCLSRPALDKQSFTFAPVVQPLAGAADTNIVVFRGATVSAPYDGKSFVYRTGPQSFESDPNAEFMASPARLLGPAIEEGLRQSGAFAQIVDPGSALRPPLSLEARVSELYGDFSKPSAPEAVLSAEFLLIDHRKGGAGELVCAVRLSRRVRLKERTAAAVAQALNTALEQTLAEAAVQLAERRK